MKAFNQLRLLGKWPSPNDNIVLMELTKITKKQPDIFKLMHLAKIYKHFIYNLIIIKKTGKYFIWHYDNNKWEIRQVVKTQNLSLNLTNLDWMVLNFANY